MAKALEAIAVARGAPDSSNQVGELNYKINIDTTQATATLEQLVKQVESDTTSQQVESLSGRFATCEELEKINETLRNAGVDENTPVDSVLMAESPTIDSTGTPWDERIHSASKALNSDGTWRLRRKPKDMDEGEWYAFMGDVIHEITPAEHLASEAKDIIEQSILRAHSSVAEQYGQGLANAAFTGDRNTAPDSIITNALKVGEPVEVAEGYFSQAYVFKSEPPVTPAGDDFHVDAGEVTEQQIAAIPAPPLPVPPVQQSDMTFPQVMQFLTERHGRITSAQVDDIIADMGLNSIMDLNTQPEYTGPFIARVKSLLGE
jgi:hypothetical protein